MAMKKRLNWQKWLIPSDVETQTEQDYWQSKRRRHMSKEHSVGIVENFNVIEQTVPDLTIRVGVGRALDASGDDVENEVAVTILDLTSYASGGGTAYIVAEFVETATNAYQVSATGLTQYKYYQESPTVTHQASAPTGDQVELARVVVTNGATTLVDAVDPFNPGNDEIDLTNRASSFPTLPAAPSEGQILVFGGDTQPWNRWAPSTMAGWKILNPSKGSINAQLTRLGITAGDRFWLPPGTYTMGADLTISQNEITIMGPRSAIVDAVTYGIVGTGDDILIEGIELRSTGADATPLVSFSGSRSRLKNCKLSKTSTNYRYYGFEFSSSASDCIVEACEFTQVGGTVADYAEIRAATGASSGNKVVGNNITVGGVAALDGHGVSAQSATAAVGMLVKDNDISVPTKASSTNFGVNAGEKWKVHHNTFVGAYTNLAKAIKAVSMTGVSILDNNFTRFSQAIQLLSSCDNCSVVNNKFSDCKETLITGAIIVSVDGSGCLITENNIDVNVTAATTLTNVYGIDMGANSEKCIISKNRISIVSDQSGLVAAYGIDLGSTDNKVSHNDIYVSLVGTAALMRGIDAAPAGTIITGNTIDMTSTGAAGTKQVGVEMAGDWIICTGNNFKITVGTDSSSDIFCIQLNGADYSTIIGNTGIVVTPGTPTGTYYNGIDFLSASIASCTVIGNNFSDAAFTAGIVMNGAGSSTFSGNVSKGAITDDGAANQMTGANVAT